MKNENIVLGIVIIIILTVFLVGADSFKGKENFGKIEEPKLEDATGNTDLTPMNSVTVPVNNISTPSERAVRQDLEINSVEALNDYKAQKQRDTDEILASTEYEDFPAIVTLSKSISASALKELKDQYDLDIVMVRYTSTVGGGEIPYQMIEDSNALKAWEDRIASDQKQHNNVKNFKLIEGFSAMRVAVKKDEVLRLQKDEKVFLVDLGPKELYIGNASAAKSKPWRDVAYFVDKYVKK